MKFTIEKTEQYVHLQVHADKIDALKTPQLKAELTTLSAEGAKSIILDLSDVIYIDSSGISALLLANRLCEAAGGILVMYGLSDATNKVIKLAQLEKVFTILPTYEEAVDAVFLHAIEADLKAGDEN
jgi:anti-anti-sigma factor